jgi:4-hydroxy-tetrahydrodipicolinate reductase
MKFLVLGALGKMGVLITELARGRGHQVQGWDIAENPGVATAPAEMLTAADVVIDFTTPHAVLGNIEACARARANMVVGTTGWYAELPRVRQLVEQSGIGFVYASNFSVGVNIFFEIARTAGAALKLGYRGHIMERHHVHKKDAPSGTAVVLQKVIKEASGGELEISSVREGETVGMHVIMLDSENDSMMLTHDAKSRRGFAEGAVRAAEWVKGKHGFHDFKEIFRQLG